MHAWRALRNTAFCTHAAAKGAVAPSEFDLDHSRTLPFAAESRQVHPPRSADSDSSSAMDASPADISAWEVDPDSLQVKEELGRGMFGTVCKAYWQGTPVAIKKVYSQESQATSDGSKDVKAQTESHKLFERELAMMRQLHHPNIVQFLGFARLEAGGFSIVMELFPHGSIEDYFRQHRGNVPGHVRLRLCDEMTQALCYLHNRKPAFLIHRDLKPSNFMLTNSLRVKLGDFGISRLLDIDRLPPSMQPSRDMDASGSFDMTTNCGTVRYMAPEVHAMPGGDTNGHTRYSPRADIFSVAMCFIFVWEGAPPSIIGAENRADHVAAIFAGKRPSYTFTPQFMREIIDRCLKLQPKERPSALKLLALLRGVSPEHKMTLFQRLCGCLVGQPEALPVPNVPARSLSERMASCSRAEPSTVVTQPVTSLSAEIQTGEMKGERTEDAKAEQRGDDTERQPATPSQLEVKLEEQSPVVHHDKEGPNATDGLLRGS